MIRTMIFVAAILHCTCVPYAHAKSPQEIVSYYGRYQIHDVQNLGGSITSDAEAARWIGSFVEIRPENFSIRNVKIKKPRYEIEKIRIEKEEGNVNPKDLSIFWGIGLDRKSVKRILVFEGMRKKHPYEKIEAIDKNNLLEIYDGRIYFFHRVDENLRLEKTK